LPADAGGMPRHDDETIEHWHTRAWRECQNASDAFELLGQRKITMANALAGDVFGPPDAEFIAVFDRLEAARVDLLAAADELVASSVESFWPRDGRREA
jgi:hypothetical protein